MLLPALLSAGFALTANAFLLPPGIAKEYQAANDNIAPVLGDPHLQTIDLDCSTCPYALASQRNGRHEWINGVKSRLEMNFAAEDQSLKLNGVPFYPVAVPFVPAPLFAKQVIKDEGPEALSKKGFEGNLRLSYSIEFESNARSQTPTQDASVVEIRMSVMALDNEMVHLDDIKIKALSFSAGGKSKPELFIVSVDTHPVDPNSADARCGTMFCRIANKFNATLQKAKSHAKAAAHRVKCFCMKSIHAVRPDHHRRPHVPILVGQPVHLPTHNRVRPGLFNPHRQAHSRHHSWVHAFVRGTKRVFSFVVLPILVGVIFGIAASTIGMLVGQVVVSLWLRYRHGSSKNISYQRLDADEKEGLPKYEDLEDTNPAAEEKI